MGTPVPAQVAPEVKPAEITIETQPEAVQLDGKAGGRAARDGLLLVGVAPGSHKIEVSGLDKRPFSR